MTASLICLHATAQAAEKAPATAAYNEKLTEIAKKALDAELLKHPERLVNGVSMKVRYSVDRNGRVHNVKVVSRTPNGWAEKTAAHVLAGIKFPPIPIEVQLEVGAGYVDAKAEVSYNADIPSASALEKQYPVAYEYNMHVHKILENDVMPEFRAPHHLEVEYEFYLDRQGHVASMKLHAKAGGQWAEQVMAHSIRRIKCPPIPPQVFKELEQKPPMRIFGTMTWDPH